MSFDVSVITVVKNDLASLKKTVASVREQKEVNIEHIVIDGGSNDGTQAWLEKLQPPLPNWSSKSDQGPYDAMNMGRAMANGQWIQFLNAGDRYYDAESLSHLVKMAKPDLQLVYGDVWRDSVDENKSITDQPITHCESPMLRRQRPIWSCGIFNNVCHQSILYNSSHLESVPFDLRFDISADCDLLLRWSFTFRHIRYAQTPKVIVRYQGQGLSEQQALRALNERKISFAQYLSSPWIRWLNRLNLERQILKLCWQRRRASTEFSTSSH
jgi:glycosyltransferase involved in cell wall biosynthesis